MSDIAPKFEVDRFTSLPPKNTFPVSNRRTFPIRAYELGYFSPWPSDLTAALRTPTGQAPRVMSLGNPFW